MKSSKKQSEKSSQQGTSTAGANQISSHGGATGGGGVSKDDKHTNPSQNVSNNTSKKQSSSNKGATGASGAGGVSAGTGGGGGSGGHVTSGGGRGVGGGGGTSNRKCEVCCVEIDPDHPDTADHEAHRVQQRPNKQQLFEIDLDRSEAVLGDLSPFIDLSHKLILTQENPSWVHKKYWNWKDCVMEVLDADSILDMVSTRRMERLFYPDHEDTTTQLFWRNLAERVCLISRLRSNPIREYDREEFTQRFLPVSATLAFDCMFAVGKKEVSYRDERNNEYTKWRDFFVIQSLYTLHEVRHFIIDWLPRKVQLEGVKFTPELQLGIREVREERLENFESRSDLVTCVFFVADVDPEAAQSKQGTAESTGGGGGSVTQGATATNSSITAGMSTLPHIVILYNFWIRSYDETRARDVSRTVSCPLFDVFNREVGTNHILRAYQSYLVMTYMNTYSTQGKMILFKINGMSDNNPELLVLDTKQISPTINVAAGWQKIAYKSLLKPTEVSILLLSELKPLTTINLNPLCANHQLKIRYSGDNLTTNIPETIQTYGVSVSASGDEALKSGSKVPLNVLMNKLNQTSTLVVKSPPFSGIQINAKVKTQSVLDETKCQVVLLERPNDFGMATIESVLFHMDQIEMVLGVGGRGGTEDFASSTNRGVATPPDTSAVTSSGGGGGSNKTGAVSVVKESKPFELSAKTHHQDSHSQVTSILQSSSHGGVLTPEVLQGSILSYVVLNNCLIVLFRDTTCYRLIKITA